MFCKQCGTAAAEGDGSVWWPMDTGTTNLLNGVWGSSATDVFAVGDNGAIMHYDGTTWSTMSSGTTNDLNAVWGNSATDVFAVGDNGTIVHYDGTTWPSQHHIARGQLGPNRRDHSRRRRGCRRGCLVSSSPQTQKDDRADLEPMPRPRLTRWEAFQSHVG